MTDTATFSDKTQKKARNAQEKYKLLETYHFSDKTQKKARNAQEKYKYH